MSAPGPGALSGVLGVRLDPPRRWLPLLLRAALTVSLLSLILVWVGPGKVWLAIRAVSPGFWLLLLAGSVLAHSVAALKWRVLLSACGARPGLFEAFRAHLAGLFANLCLPTLVGGDVVRVGLLVRRHETAPLVVGGLADRVLDTAALIVIAALGARLLPGALDVTALRLLEIATAVLFAAVLVAPFVLRRVGPHSRLLPRFARPFVLKLRAAAESLRGRPGAALLAFGVALGIQGFYVFLNLLLGRAIGIDLHASVWLLAFPLTKLAALVPVSLGGAGVRELVLATLLEPFGVARELAVAQSLVWWSITLGLGLLAGLVASALSRAQAAEAPESAPLPGASEGEAV